MFPNLPLPAAQEVRDSSNAVTPCIVMQNDVLYLQVSSFSPESMRLRSLRLSEWTAVRDPVQHKRWTYPCYRAVISEHPLRWTRWWCTTHRRLARWIKWRTCDVGEPKKGMENELWRRWSDGKLGEWAGLGRVFFSRGGERTCAVADLDTL